MKNLSEKDTFIDSDGDRVIGSLTIAKLNGKRHNSILCAIDGLLDHLEYVGGRKHNGVKIKPIVPEDIDCQFTFNLNMKALDLLMNGF